ncbi:hypothetical protein BC628DRAFT_1355648 [Trametes gibbosa]|nr:hypothetical protein BC628DRAFT_1355648 [Trametes gibbosa]
MLLALSSEANVPWETLELKGGKLVEHLVKPVSQLSRTLAPSPPPVSPRADRGTR